MLTSLPLPTLNVQVPEQYFHPIGANARLKAIKCERGKIFATSSEMLFFIRFNISDLLCSSVISYFGDCRGNFNHILWMKGEKVFKRFTKNGKSIRVKKILVAFGSEQSFLRGVKLMRYGKARGGKLWRFFNFLE